MKFANKKLSDKSIMRYNDAIKNLISYLSTNNQDLTLESVKSWLATIDNSNTFNVCYFAIKSYLLEMYKDKSIEERMALREFFDSMRFDKPDKSISQIEYLTKKEVEEIAKLANEKIGCFIMALFQTGCRITELINVRLTRCKSKKGYVFIQVLGKNSKERTVTMTQKLYDNICSIFNGKQYLFETIHGDAYAREYVSREIKKIARKAGHEGISAHSLRHSKAMYLKEEKGRTPDEIAKALGHSNTLTTLQYYFHTILTAEDQLADF